MKKLISMLMAGAMTLALAAPALADPGAYSGVSDLNSGTVSNQENKISLAAETAVPTITLTMPKVEKTRCVIVNPYALKWSGTINGKTVATADYDTSQVISPVFRIKNQTNGELTVTASVTCTVKGNMKLVETTPTSADNNTNNWAQITLKAEKVNKDDGVAGTFSTSAKTLNLKAGTVKLENGTGENAAQNAITLPEVATGADENYLIFTFTGSANTKPKTPWTTNDSVAIEITWNFTPADNTPPAANNGG